MADRLYLQWEPVRFFFTILLKTTIKSSKIKLICVNFLFTEKSVK